MAADVAPAANFQPRAKVFISYSRKDMVFADRLDAALKARGFEPLIDREQIYAFTRCKNNNLPHGDCRSIVCQ